MIIVNDDYVIDVNEHCYVAKRDTHQTRIEKSTGKEIQVYNIVGYYGHLEEAIKAIIQHTIQCKLSNDVVDLRKAWQIVKEETRKFDELLKKAAEV